MGIQEAVQHLARETASHQRHVQYAKVLQVDHKRNRAKVALLPTKNETGFLRIANNAVGDGWTMHIPIFKNDLVIVEFPSGQIGSSGIITWRMHHEEGDDPEETDPKKWPKRRWPNMDNWLPEKDLRRCSYKDVFMLHKSGSYLRFYGEDAKNSRNGLHQPNVESDIRLHARKRNGKGGILQIRADARLELVAPEIRIRTLDGKDTGHYFVLKDWVDEWNHFINAVFNPHIHIDPGEFATGAPIIKYFTRFGAGNLPYQDVCDMHTHGTVGYEETKTTGEI
jgi:hypothetical protein